MKSSGPCPRCSSTDILRDVDPSTMGGDAYHTLELAAYRRPQALLFRGRESTPVRACVCVGCGYVEFYATNPEVLAAVRRAE